VISLHVLASMMELYMFSLGKPTLPPRCSALHQSSSFLLIFLKYCTFAQVIKNPHFH
jgi:hypothetical protein